MQRDWANAVPSNYCIAWGQCNAMAMVTYGIITGTHILPPGDMVSLLAVTGSNYVGVSGWCKRVEATSQELDDLGEPALAG